MKPKSDRELVILSVQKVKWNTYRDVFESVVVISTRQKPVLEVPYFCGATPPATIAVPDEGQMQLFRTEDAGF